MGSSSSKADSGGGMNNTMINLTLSYYIYDTLNHVEIFNERYLALWY